MDHVTKVGRGVVIVFFQHGDKKQLWALDRGQ